MGRGAGDAWRVFNGEEEAVCAGFEWEIAGNQSGLVKMFGLGGAPVRAWLRHANFIRGKTVG